MNDPRRSLDSFGDWEEPTQNGGGSRAVRDLSDPDVHVMLGKMARALADTQSEVKQLVRAWKSERHARRAQRRREAGLVVGGVGIIQAILTALHQVGILK